MNNQFFSIVEFLLFAISLIFCDFTSKQWILNNINLYEKIPICSTINIVHVNNYGVSFDFLAIIFSKKKWMLCAFQLLVLCIVLKKIYFEMKQDNKRIDLYFVFSGAVGNYFSRLHYGYVIDFINIKIQKNHYLIFNLADLFIFIGLFFLFTKKFYGLQKIKQKN